MTKIKLLAVLGSILLIFLGSLQTFLTLKDTSDQISNYITEYNSYGYSMSLIK